MSVGVVSEFAVVLVPEIPGLDTSSTHEVVPVLRYTAQTAVQSASNAPTCGSDKVPVKVKGDPSETCQYLEIPTSPTLKTVSINV